MSVGKWPSVLPVSPGQCIICNWYSCFWYRNWRLLIHMCQLLLVCRSLQLVYCVNVLEQLGRNSYVCDRTNLAFESVFPFDPYRLPQWARLITEFWVTRNNLWFYIRSSFAVLPLYRTFSPLVDAGDLKLNRIGLSTTDEDDFLGSAEQHSGLFMESLPDRDLKMTVYATSPGLKHLMDNNDAMDYWIATMYQMLVFLRFFWFSVCFGGFCKIVITFWPFFIAP